MKHKYNFKKFINSNIHQIFGTDSTKIGRPLSIAYKKQINALDIKMNEIIFEKDEKYDPIFLLGLFDLALNQFSKTMTTNISNYQELFLEFLENGKETID